MRGFLPDFKGKIACGKLGSCHSLRGCYLPAMLKTENAKNLKTVLFLLLLPLSLFLLFRFSIEEEKEREVVTLGEDRFFTSPNHKVTEKGNYLLVETPEISLEVPKDWEIDSYKEELQKGIDISTPSCNFYLTSYREKNENDYLKSSISALLHEEIERENIKLIKIDGIYAIEQEAGPVKVPYKEKIYEIGVSTKEKKTECREKLYELLNSVSFFHKNEK